MYPNLNNIGLADFIAKSCGGTEQEDPCFRSLDNFVKELSKENINILESKFSKNKSHMQKNDSLNELKIMLLFHPNADFVEESAAKSPDLYDKERNCYIEVKTLRESHVEQGRHEIGNTLNIVSVALTDEERESANIKAISAIKKKAEEHLQKASKQLKDKGIAYLIWDFDNLFRGAHKRVVSREEVEKTIMQTVRTLEENKPCLHIRPYYFEDLNKKIGDRDASVLLM